MKKFITLVLGLVILALMVATLLELERHPGMRILRTKIIESVEVISANVVDSFLPERRPPVTTVELEENLKLYLPEPFAQFSDEDWQWFWNLFYGSFTMDAPGWVKRKRQLTKEEIEQTLTEELDQPFSYFDEGHWQGFWQQGLNGRVFR